MLIILYLIYPLILKRALYRYLPFTYSSTNDNFVLVTFGSEEYYSNPLQSLTINYLQDDASIYAGTPYLFISAGYGGGPGFMYLKLDYSNIRGTLCSKYILKNN